MAANDRREERRSREAVDIVPASIGPELRELYSTVLAAAISFLPSLYLFIIPDATRLGLDEAATTVLWVFLATVMLNEWWRNRRFYWRHRMDFRSVGVFGPKVLTFLYATIASAYILTVVALPASVAFSSFGQSGAVGRPVEGYELLTPVFTLLLTHNILSLFATGMKRWIPQEKPEGLQLALEVAGDIVPAVAYAVYIRIGAEHESVSTGLSWLIGVYVMGAFVHWLTRALTRELEGSQGETLVAGD